MRYLGVKMMDFELEIVLTQPWLGDRGTSQPARTKKQNGGVQHKDFQEVTHPSTTLAQAHITAEFWWDPVH